MKSEVTQESSAELWKAVRDRVRASLYILISYAELLTEQAGEFPILHALLGRLLPMCEILLQETVWQPGAGQAVGEESVRERFQEILAHRGAFQQIAQELEAISILELRYDLALLIKTMAAFQEILGILAEDPAR